MNVSRATRNRPSGPFGAGVACACLLVSCCGPSAPGPEPARPNVIYIYADDLGYGELGAYGQAKIRTPRLDQLAAEGIRFTHHYASSPVCAPSRNSLLTGMHTGHGYVRSNYELGGFTDDEERGQMPLHDGAYTVAHLMREAGYATAAIGKWGLGMHDNTGAPTRHGFDLFFGYLDQKQAHNYYPTHLWENAVWVPLDNRPFDAHQRVATAPATAEEWNAWKGRDYAPEAMTDRAIRFLQEHRGQRFFLYLPYPLPHVALQAPDDTSPATRTSSTTCPTSVSRDISRRAIRVRPTRP